MLLLGIINEWLNKGGKMGEKIVRNRPGGELSGRELSVGNSLSYFGKRKQVTKVTFLVKGQNVSVISIDINGYHDVLPNRIFAG